jgi:hydrogenase-4 component B
MALAGLGYALLPAVVAGLAIALLLPALAALIPALPAALRSGVPRAFAVAACALAAFIGALLLAGGQVPALTWSAGFPGDAFTLAPDALAAPFLLLFGLVGALSFATHEPHGSALGSSARLSLHAGFALALFVVFTTRHALLFLMAWEAMTLLSAALVASDPRSARARSAAWVYLALSHAGAACLAYALVTLAARAGSWDFAALAQVHAQLPPAESMRLAWWCTAGFIVKLGLVPVHVWLPLAHPEAPAPVSAMLSGVMVKAGLYGLLRFAWQLPGSPPTNWGTVLIIMGVISALAGALYAAVESDAKRLLAFSTIKHAGLIATATGLAAVLAENNQREIAGVALAAALYHAVGHGLAKGLAFVSIGEAAHATGTRQLEALGGLARKLPAVSAAALVSSLALCALPPLSCFGGEWLIFQSLILGYSAGAGQLRLLAPFAGAGLALAGALAIAAMVKLYGIAFLGRPRTEAAVAPHATSPLVARVLVAACALPLLWGLAAPWLAPTFAAPLATLLPGFDAYRMSAANGFQLVPAGLQRASVSPIAVLALLGIFALIARVWLRAARGPLQSVRVSPSWSCGTPLEPQMQYSALGFTKPLRLIFEPVLRATREVEVLERGSPYFAKRYKFRAGMQPVFEEWLYQPAVQAVLWTSEQARRLQTGSLHLYLAYLLATLVALLLWAR